jgi:hypothetical protein
VGLNVHFHCLVLDGVYVRDDDGELRFHELGAPTHEEITDVARWTHERLGRVLERHGRSLDEGAPDDGAADLLAREQPVLASCYEASTADRQLLGDAPGLQTRKLAHVVRELAKPNDALAEVTEARSDGTSDQPGRGCPSAHALFGCSAGLRPSTMRGKKWTQDRCWVLLFRYWRTCQ